LPDTFSCDNNKKFQIARRVEPAFLRCWGSRWKEH